MNDTLIEEVIRMGAVILIPILPAYILYKTLRSTAVVNGPLKGFKIHLGGAFAGYFTLVLVLLAFFKAPPKYELWEVRGQIQCDTCGEFDTRHLNLSLKPPNQAITSDGMFDVLISRGPGMNGEVQFPTLVIEYPDVQTVSIDLNKEIPINTQNVKRVTKDSRSREIMIEGNSRNAILLQKKQPYPHELVPPQLPTPSQVGELYR